MCRVVEIPVPDTRGQLNMLTLSPYLLVPACDIAWIRIVAPADT